MTTIKLSSSKKPESGRRKWTCCLCSTEDKESLIPPVQRCTECSHRICPKCKQPHRSKDELKQQNENTKAWEKLGAEERKVFEEFLDEYDLK